MAAPTDADPSGRSFVVFGGVSKWLSSTRSSATPGIVVPMCFVSRQYPADAVAMDRGR